MTTKSKKNILGDGAEFGWVGSQNEQDSSSLSPEQQVDKELRPHRIKVKRQKISVYMNSDTVIDLKMQAIREGRSASAVVEELVFQYCESKSKLKTK